MTYISSFVDYLPSVLWSQKDDSSRFLGRMLCIFEEILTGIPDGDTYNFEKVIDELAQLFNPWKTNEKFLPWLASWVALTLSEDFSEYQKRKLISEIVSVYQERGLKNSLQSYLDICSTYLDTDSAYVKPRMAIDDGVAVLRATFLDNGTAILHTVAHSNVISNKGFEDKNKFVTVLLCPSAIAADDQNNYIVADMGDSSLQKPQIPQRPSIWKLSSTGDIGYYNIIDEKSGTQTMVQIPKPIYAGNYLQNPTAVVVDSINRYSFVDTGSGTSTGETSKPGIYRITPPDNPSVDPSINSRIEKVINQSTNPGFTAVYPVDMICDNLERFIVLDRGNADLEKDAKSKIVVVSENPQLNVEDHPLEKVVEPTALTMDSNGNYIVADAKKQSDEYPASLVRVEITVKDNQEVWSETLLLDEVKNNPLIYPTGLAFENSKLNSQSLFVCDKGIRGVVGGGSGYAKMAETAAVYRIDFPQTPSTPPTITRVTYENKLVNPTKMMIDRKRKLIITDRGESLQIPQRNWRTRANEFGISVLFSLQHSIPETSLLNQDPSTSLVIQDSIMRKIKITVDEQKPENTLCWIKKF